MGQVARSGDENGLQDMTTTAQTTLLHAAELLESAAVKMREWGNSDPRNLDWRVMPFAQAVHDDALTTALELRLLATRIQDGKAAVSPVPTFEGK